MRAEYEEERDAFDAAVAPGIRGTNAGPKGIASGSTPHGTSHAGPKGALGAAHRTAMAGIAGDSSSDSSSDTAGSGDEGEAGWKAGSKAGRGGNAAGSSADHSSAAAAAAAASDPASLLAARGLAASKVRDSHGSGLPSLDGDCPTLTKPR